MHVHRRLTHRRQWALALTAPALVLAGLVPSAPAIGAPSATAPATSAVRPSPAPTPSCAGALVPVAGSFSTPHGGSFSTGDSTGPGSVFLLGTENQADGSQRWVVRHGPSVGPFTRAGLSSADDVFPYSLVAVDAQHAWMVGMRLRPDGVHHDLAVWHAEDGSVSQVTIPSALLPSGVDTRGSIVDGSSDHDVWVLTEWWSGTEYDNALLHWDGATWSRVPGQIPPGNVTLASTGAGSVALSVKESDGTEHWYASRGSSLQDVSGPGPSGTVHPEVNILRGHGRPLAVWYDQTGTLVPWQWRAGAWHPLTPLHVDFTDPDYEVAPDGSLWAAITDYLPTMPTVRPRSVAVLDGTTWTRSGTLDDASLGYRSVGGGLLPLDATESLSVGSRIGAGASTVQPSLRHTCFATLSSTGLTHPVVRTEIGLPVAVHATHDVSGAVSLTDDLTLVTPTQVTADHWAQLAYPWPGTYTATLGAGLGTLTTSTAFGVSETSNRNRTVFHDTLRLASAAPPAGWTIEVQQRQAGQTTWTRLIRTTRTELALHQIPADQAGTWHFRARLLRLDGTASSGWSAELTTTRRDVVR